MNNKMKLRYTYEVTGEMMVDANNFAEFEAKSAEILSKAERNICRAFNDQCITGKVRVLQRETH